ncbi:MAG: hypothetical protein ABJO38_04485, partial [Stappiaceae bacterium]
MDQAGKPECPLGINRLKKHGFNFSSFTPCLKKSVALLSHKIRSGERTTIRILKSLLRIIGHMLFVGATLYAGGAIHYWLGWPGWVRDFGAVFFVGVCLFYWFIPWQHQRIRRLICLSFLAVLFIAYFAKTPIERTWDPRHEKRVTAVIDGDLVTFSNFRDAVHRIDEPAHVRWTTRTVDLSTLQSAELIMQPFGSFKALEHVMMSF